MLMRRSWLLLLLCAPVGATFCTAQTPPPELILSRCAQAMGSGQAGISILAEGQIQSPGSEALTPIRIQTRGLDDFRSEVGAGDQKSLTVMHRQVGEQHRQNEIHRMPRHLTAYFKPDHLPALICGMTLPPGEMQVLYVGEDEVDNIPVFHLKFNAVPKNKSARTDSIESLISEYHLFIDKESFVVRKSSSIAFSPQAIENHSAWETYYSDYRRVDGILMPFKTENFLAGQKVRTITFTSIRTNISFADQDFQLQAQ